jgi:hypothetical protein
VGQGQRASGRDMEGNYMLVGERMAKSEIGE